MDFRRLPKFFYGSQYSPAPRVPQNHDQAGAEPHRGELGAANLRRRNDVSGNTDDKKVAEPLIEYDLDWDPRVGTTQNNRERLSVLCHLDLQRMTQVLIATPRARGKPTVPLAKTFKCFFCIHHRFAYPHLATLLLERQNYQKILTSDYSRRGCYGNLLYGTYVIGR
jgi:hypothetical protein